MDTSQLPRAPMPVEQFVKQLYVTSKAVKLYPPTNSIPRDNAAEAVDLLRGLLEKQAEMRLSVSKDGFAHEGFAVAPSQPAYGVFARELYSRNVSELRFHSGAGVDDILGVLGVLNVEPDDLAQGGGFAQRLWDLSVDGVTVKEIAARVVDVDADAGEADTTQNDWPPADELVDDILLGAFGGRSRDQRVIVRVIEDPERVGSYLRRSLERRGQTSPTQWIANRLAALARAVQQELPDDQPALARSLAESLLDLDPELVRDTLMERMLPGARHDTASALVLAGLTLDEMCDALAYGLGETQEAQMGLSRAVQNLMRLGMHDRDDVLGAAASAMAGAGLSEGFGAAVLEEAHPSQLKIEKMRPVPEEAALTSVLKLIDITSTEHTIPIDTDTEITALRVGARRGITDGDVLGSLVTIAALEKRREPFASIMSLLEDNAQLLIDRQEFDVAVWAAQALRRASAEEERDEAQRRRISEVLGLLADKRSIRTITQAMRSYPSSSREHQACRSLIRTLGEHAINGLLEVLAEEPDMGARKAIVDVMADMAAPHISKLGAYLGDNRWYFVRNIVSILASTRDPAVLPHLQRTLRYPDARVRRETIRAAAGIRDARAGQMLVAALADEDAQNVQIAARFLGSSRWRGGVTALHQVAQGEGKGNRETGPRVEAIEALGQIGAPESVPVLKSISRAGLLSRGRSKELRAAADSALTAIKSISSKGGR